MVDLVTIFESNRLGGMMSEHRCVCGEEITERDKEIYDGYCSACYCFEVTDTGRCECGRNFVDYEEIEPGLCWQCVQERDEELCHPDQKAHEGKRLGDI